MSLTIRPSFLEALQSPSLDLIGPYAGKTLLAVIVPRALPFAPFRLSATAKCQTAASLASLREQLRSRAKDSVFLSLSFLLIGEPSRFARPSLQFQGYRQQIEDHAWAQGQDTIDSPERDLVSDHDDIYAHYACEYSTC